MSPDEISLRQLFAPLWYGRGIVVGGAMLFFLIGASIYGYRFLKVPERVEFYTTIQFSFDGLQNGQYPNGTQFRLSDVISTQVLSRIYRRLELDRYGLTPEGFANRVTIRPYAANREFIDAKYKGSLASVKLSQTEITDLEQAYTAELNSALRGGAKLSFYSSLQDKIPNVAVFELLNQIPEEWSEVAIRERGVLDLPVVTARAFSVEELGSIEYVSALWRVRSDVERLDADLDRLAADDRVSLVRDPESGSNVFDIRKQLDVLMRFGVEPVTSLVTEEGVAKDARRARSFLEARLRILRDKQDELRRKGLVFARAFDTHKAADLRAERVATTGSGMVGQQAQLGDEFIGRLLKLGDEVSEAQYRQSLTKSRIDFELKSEEITTEILAVERQLDGLNGRDGRDGNGSLDALVKAEVSKVSKQFGKQAKAYEGLIEAARQVGLSDTRSLYELTTETPERRGSYRSQLTRALVSSAVFAAIGTAFSLIAAFVWSLLRRRLQ